MNKISLDKKQFHLNRIEKIIRIRRRRRHKRFRKPPVVRIIAPEIIDFAENFDETVRFFRAVRDLSSKLYYRRLKFQVNFTTIKTISHAAALVLTSEFDRLKRIGLKWGMRGLSVVDFHEWDEGVKRRLRDMGMYDLLSINNVPRSFTDEESESDEYYLKFISGRKVSPDDAIRMREILKELIKVVPNSKKLQVGLTEAMANSLEHAYPEDHLREFDKRMWWMSASYHCKNDELTVSFFDQGIGIPKSLPLTRKKFVGTAFNLLDSDGKKIMAATQIGRSKIGAKHRGKGLQDIKDYISSEGGADGRLRIISNRGIYCFCRENSVINEDYTNGNSILEGTLLEWKTKLS